MAEISATTQFTVEGGTPAIGYTDVQFAAAATGFGNAFRRLDPPSPASGYPDLPPLVYDCNPDRWTNFDTSPLRRPFTRHQHTMGGAVTQEWPGYDADVVIEEVWEGGGDRAAMNLSFFRLLYQYYINRPNYDTQGYIKWTPADLTNKQYNIVILDLSVGGVGAIELDFAMFHGLVREQVIFQFAIVSEV